MKIYTKSGDKGETSLFDGTRINKVNARIKAYGTVDEVNSQIGLLICHCYHNNTTNSNITNSFEDVVEVLFIIQRQLFKLGSDLANPDFKSINYPRIDANDTSYLERSIDNFDKELEQLKSFILPGGSIQSALCHIIRTIIRRAEIAITELYLKQEVDDKCTMYINRLSDLFFVLSRIFNKRQDVKDIIWKP